MVERAPRARLIDAEDQKRLAERFAAERIQLDQELVDQRLALDVQHARKVAELERRRMVELARLWRSQGRQLGAWAARLGVDVEGDDDVST